MLSIDFSGWFECRLATDSDPSDETRGVTGFTRAVAGEPDLDRKIRFQPLAGRPTRTPGPAVGVRVTRAVIDGTIAAAALVGARVDLLSDPTYEGRNGLAFDDELEPVLPFHIHIAGQDVTLEREHRNEVTGQWIRSSPIEVARDAGWLMQKAVGHDDPIGFITNRRREITAAIRAAKQPIDRFALSARRLHLYRTRRTVAFFLPFAMRYRLVMAGPWVRIADPAGRLPARVDTAPWTCTFWMGVWDADALCGYVDGTLTAPLR